MAAEPTPRPGWEHFAAPVGVNQRRYETLRAYFAGGASIAAVAEQFGYTRSAMVSLLRDHRAGKLELFAPPGRPRPKSAPAKDRARARVVQLRREGLSTYEISARLRAEGRPLNRTGVGQVLAEEGFGRLIRGRQPEASINPATTGRDTHLPATKVIDFTGLPDRAETAMAGLLLTIPDLLALNLPALDTKMIGAGLADTDQAIFDLDFHAVMH